jgi:hypothetical protein
MAESTVPVDWSCSITAQGKCAEIVVDRNSGGVTIDYLSVKVGAERVSRDVSSKAVSVAQRS